MEPLFLQIKHLLGSTYVDDVVAVAENVACCCFLMLKLSMRVFLHIITYWHFLIDEQAPTGISIFVGIFHMPLSFTNFLLCLGSPLPFSLCLKKCQYVAKDKFFWHVLYSTYWHLSKISISALYR